MSRRKMDAFKTPDLVVAETGKHVPEQQAYLNLMRTSQVLGQDVSDLLAGFGLSGRQYNALRAIRRGGDSGASVSQISQQMTDPRADVTRLMDRLVRDGWVRREHDETDRRIVRSHLNEKGKELLVRIEQPLVDLHIGQLQHLSKDELEQLSALLQKARGEG